MNYLEPDELHRIVDNVRDQSDHDREDGVPLYSYHVKPEDLQRLRAALKRRFSEPREWHAVDSAAYCLFAARYFCQHYAGGPWAWRTINDALGVGGRIPGLYTIVTRGLGFWGRKVVRIGLTSQYLVTLACEGGLPLQVLLREGAPLRRYFRVVLEFKELYPTVASRELSERMGDALPKTLRSTQVFELAANLIDAVSELRRAVPAVIDAENPVALLDHTLPKWRSRVPLELGHGVASGLLHGLLRHSTPVGEDAHGVGIRVITTLQLGAEPSITRSITASPRITRRALFGALVDSQDQLDKPGMVHLAVEAASAAPRSLGRCIPIYGEDAYRTQFAPFHYQEARPRSSRILITAAQGSVPLGRVIVLGGEPLSDLPWIFRPDGEDARLIGEGTAQTGATSAFVACSRSTRPTPHDASCAELVGDLPALDRDLYRVEGVVRFEEGEDVFVVRTSASSEVASHFWLQGTELQTRDSSAPYIGAPTVFERNAQGIFRTVPTREIMWKVAGAQSNWRADLENCVGTVWLRVIRGGETLYRVRVAVLPLDFQIDAEAAPLGSTATIRLRSSSLTGVELHGETDASISRRGDKFVLEIEAHTERPTAIRTMLDFGSNRHVQMMLGTPVIFAGFSGIGHNVLDVDATVAIDDLFGKRAEVIGGNTADRYFVSGGGVFAEIPRVKGLASRELPLDVLTTRLENWFAGTDDLSAGLHLQVTKLGLPIPGSPRRLRIQRYRARLERNDVAGTGTSLLTLADHQLSADLVNRIKILAHPFWSLDAEGTELAVAGEGVWNFDQKGLEPGPYLVTGHIDEQLTTRPLRMTVTGEPQLGDKTSLQKLFFRLDDDRREATAALLDELAKDPEHEDWEGLQLYLERIGDLPPSSIDLYACLGNHPDAVAAAAVRFSSFNWFERFWDQMETLPFLWSLIPLRSWHDAVASMQGVLHGQRDALALGGVKVAEAARAELHHLAEKASPSFPQIMVTLEWIGAKTRWALPIDSPTLGLPDAFLEGLLQEESQRFMNRAGDATYPRLAWQEAMQSLNLPTIVDGLFLDLDVMPYREAALNAPAIAALAAIYGPGQIPAIGEFLRRTRSFDEEWFGRASAIWLARHIQQARTKYPEVLDG